MIKRYGSQCVRKGYYWDVGRWKFILIERDGDSLPGPSSCLYLQLNIFEWCALAAFMGGIYVMFLPLVGFVVVFTAIFVTVLSFVVQKILCNIIRKICQAEHWLCEITHRYLCKQCGVDCDDNITMIVRGFTFSLFFLSGVLIHKYFLM